MIYVVASALMNVTASVLLKLASANIGQPEFGLSDTRTLFLLTAAAGTYCGAFVAYFLALSHLPIGTTYVSITGAATIIIAAVGVVAFHERLSALQLASMGLILAGLVGLHMKN